ncbi:MRN complex-interacting protein [Toxotes jaculatrix]|uniref:MRN complex-interacting protein n=1 Tax=Toxotes jaculatrix TaxID=941984 RepID=UPI001B3AFF60|nr:MRN complex-interacting protein [Toxotes jaculatrix]
MVQEFHVLRCFRCDKFQVQQVKKVNRWSCKVCGEKQSLFKEFGRGSGADCRRHVQKLNAMRGAMMEEQERHTWSPWEQVEADGEERDEQVRTLSSVCQDRPTQVSRWSKYLDTPREAEPEEENVLMDRQQLRGNNTDRKRKTTDTPEQPSCSSLMRTRTSRLRHTCPPSLSHTGPPSLSRTSLSHTGPPSLSRTSLSHTGPPSLSHTSPPSKKRINPPLLSTGPVSRWTHFLSSDCKEQEEVGPSASGRGQSEGGATSLPCGDIISRPHPSLPVSSLFEIGEEFSFDDEEFVTGRRENSSV